MIPYTLRQLEYFLACVDHKSIARAADTLNVSQPTISVSIAKLEAQFGVQLLIRHHSQGVSPTASAEKILQSTRSLVAHATDLHRQAVSSGTALAGDLRIGSFSTLAATLLPSLINGMGKIYPDISLHLREGTQEVLAEALFDGNLDVALLYDIDLPVGLRCVRLAEREPYVALPEDHPLASRKAISLTELVDLPLILLDLVPSRSYFLSLFASAGLKPKIGHSSPSLELVRGMVGHGLGYSILVTRPHGDLTHDGKRLIIRPLTDVVAKSTMVLASLKSLRPTRLMSSFEDFAVKLLSSTEMKQV